MPAAVEDKVLVDFVRHRNQVVAPADVCDLVQLGLVEHLPARVVGRIEQQQPGPVRDRRFESPDGQLPAVAVARQTHRYLDCARHGHYGCVGVIGRLEHEHLVAGLAETDDGGGHRLGGTGSDEHLATWVVDEAVLGLLVLRYRLQQVPHARPRVGTGCRLPRWPPPPPCAAVRARPFGKALAEVDCACGHRQRRHLGEDRRAERGQARGNPPATGRQHGHDRCFARSWSRMPCHRHEHRALVMARYHETAVPQ